MTSRIFGHETAGIIAATGADVNNWNVGDRVIVLHHALDCTRKGGKILFLLNFLMKLLFP